MPTYKDYPLNGIDYEYEQLESLVVTSLLRHGMHCVDLGANSGHFTMLMALYTGGTGRVLSVEPDPIMLARCRTNVWSNGMRTVELLCAACGSPRVSRLYLDAGGGGDNRLVQYDGEDRSYVLTPVLSLNQITDLLPERRVDFLKIDVQGAEPEVFASGDAFFARTPDLGMLVEYDPYALEGFGHSGRQVTDALHRLGFHVFILNSRMGRLLHLPAGKTIRRSILGARGVLNLLCLRGRWAEDVPPLVNKLFMHCDPSSLED